MPALMVTYKPSFIGMETPKENPHGKPWGKPNNTQTQNDLDIDNQIF